MPLPNPLADRYITPAGLRGPSGDLFPGALSILKGAVPDPVPGPGHTAPTYVVGSRDRPPTTIAAPRSPFMPDPDPAALKDRIRREAFARRDGLDKALRRAASRAIAERALALPELRDIQPVGGYWPIRSEVDPRPLMRRLLKRGQEVALSQIIHPRLSWRLWRPGDVLIRGGFGVREPGPDAPECFPMALLVPLAAFDRACHRIGYGKGHFDRAIAALSEMHPLLTVGLAFSAQQIERVPGEAHDRVLDLVVTEAEVIRPKTS
jgi:5-formyltetrahydrofolate cyclo-ligase